MACAAASTIAATTTASSAATASTSGFGGDGFDRILESGKGGVGVSCDCSYYGVGGAQFVGVEDVIGEFEDVFIGLCIELFVR